MQVLTFTTHCYKMTLKILYALAMPVCFNKQKLTAQKARLSEKVAGNSKDVWPISSANRRYSTKIQSCTGYKSLPQHASDSCGSGLKLKFLKYPLHRRQRYYKCLESRQKITPRVTVLTQSIKLNLKLCDFFL